MQLFIWLLRIFLFLLLVSFAAKNSEPVTLYYYLDQTVQLPMSIVLLICFTLGTVIGYLSCLTTRFRKK
ncbi:Protein of unknown function [Nitrosomonas cryotolerans]|uniref:Lipopolysaccharide assembly protein A domain-containing protein n=1 Tax=Nitrosomonas cryotolerans ATCC 49181 TaxID=1131553 RepID=A0A1N6GXN1_9PROT|nr:LapA family protein [Nitrosomonas cryotolerans]SFP42360.1 Protein of unknown function [Nitrosomonas cryotolerans]SIO12308.1 Protein of unknown function [Nitrosomonas cryotolerans ATCC 49181]